MSQLSAKIRQWNNKYQADLWWRRKYKVAFNSEQHRSVNQIDILWEFAEEQMINNKRQLDKYFEDRPHQWWFVPIDKSTPEEFDELVQSIDLSMFDDK